MHRPDPLEIMWLQAMETLEKAERLNRLLFFIQRSRSRLPAWEPPIDIVEVLDELRISAVVPGISPEMVEVTLEGGMLRIAGERPPPVVPGTTRIHRLEIPYGRFERRIHLPPGRYELIESRYQRGCLELCFRKRS
ncbi:MAG: Hsp20/alpha crystallin family protein [Methylohalobius sp.]|nr:Hsp20/alpha crystallin family protein [Methylohalobius sp.]